MPSILEDLDLVQVHQSIKEWMWDQKTTNASLYNIKARVTMQLVNQGLQIEQVGGSISVVEEAVELLLEVGVIVKNVSLYAESYSLGKPPCQTK